MPIQDWTKVRAEDVHDFHQVWTGQLRIALYSGRLPPGHYAQIEQQPGDFVPDVLTLHESRSSEPADPPPPAGAPAVAVSPRKVAVVADLEGRLDSRRQDRVTIRHGSDNRLIALREIISSGNKAGERELKRFVGKICSAIDQGIHVVIVDLYPPAPRDPERIHGAIRVEFAGDATRCRRIGSGRSSVIWRARCRAPMCSRLPWSTRCLPCPYFSRRRTTFWFP